MKRLTLISGPCLVEDYSICARVADVLLEVSAKYDIEFIFKASVKKANRTKGDSFRTIGEIEALEILRKIKNTYGVRITTDVHEVSDMTMVRDAVDVIQIPAFLCRQTELIEAAADTGLTVNIKKGQFASADTMAHAADKVRSKGNDQVWLTERGNSFGYENLVVDMLNIPGMKPHAEKVIMDCTHATQRTNQSVGVSGGDPAEAFTLMRAAIAVGVDGIFAETHPDPSKALSDSGSMILLSEMERFVAEAYELYTFINDRP